MKNLIMRMAICLAVIFTFAVFASACGVTTVPPSDVPCENHRDLNFDNFCEICGWPLDFDYSIPNPDFNKALENLEKNNFIVSASNEAEVDQLGYEGLLFTVLGKGEDEFVWAFYFESAEAADKAWEGGLEERLQEIKEGVIPSVAERILAKKQANLVYFATDNGIKATYASIFKPDEEKEYEIPAIDPTIAYHFLTESGFDTDLVYYDYLPEEMKFDGLICGVEAELGPEHIVIFYFESEEAMYAAWTSELEQLYEDYEAELIADGKNLWKVGKEGKIAYGGSPLAIKATHEVVKVDVSELPPEDENEVCLSHKDNDGDSRCDKCGAKLSTDNEESSGDKYLIPEMDIEVAKNNLMANGYEVASATHDLGSVLTVTRGDFDEYLVIFYFDDEETAEANWDSYTDQQRSDFVDYVETLTGKAGFVGRIFSIWWYGTENAIKATLDSENDFDIDWGSGSSDTDASVPGLE